jgi:hypothetical protein
MFKSRIYIDGVDSFLKSAIVKELKNSGYENVYNGSVLTNYLSVPLEDLPNEINDNETIISSVKKIVDISDCENTINNRLKLDGTDIFSNNLETSSVYIILDSDIKIHTSRRIHPICRYNSTIFYHKYKYLFLALKYEIPIIDTKNKTLTQILLNIKNLLNGKIWYSPKFDYKLMPNYDAFCPAILDLEWMNIGASRILYADEKIIVHIGNNNFNVSSYQENVIKQISKQQLKKCFG